MCAQLDLIPIAKDFERVTVSANRQTIALWMPRELWEKLSDLAKGTTAQSVNRARAMDSYQLVFVVDMQKAPGSDWTFTPRDTLASSLTLENSNGSSIHPLAPEAVSADASNVLQTFRPAMRNLFGQFGEHCELFVFSATDQNGQRFAEPAKNGSLIVHLDGLALSYQLPLESTLPSMVDPKTGASFSGNYHFNPFTGDRLEPAPAHK